MVETILYCEWCTPRAEIERVPCSKDGPQYHNTICPACYADLRLDHYEYRCERDQVRREQAAREHAGVVG